MKNLSSKFLHSTSEEIKKSVELFINKLNNSTDVDDIKNNLLKQLNNNIEILKKSIKEKNNIEEITEIIKDILSSIYISLKSTISFINNDEYTINNIFIDSNNNIKKIFDDDEKIFDKNIEQFTLLLIEDMTNKFNINKGEKDEELDTILQDVDNELSNEINDKKTEEIDENIIKVKDSLINWINLNIINKIKNKMKL
ncbi:MAG: hypothetical protein WDA02_10000 [Saccharofermentanales bacterium]